MNKTLFLFLSFCMTICCNAQSLNGQWASLQPIDEQPAYLILQFEEKDSVGIGLLFEMENSGIKIKITSTCDGLYESDGEIIEMNFIDSTLKTSSVIDLPKEVKSQLQGETEDEFNNLKKQLGDEINGRFKKILPLMKSLEILLLTEKDLKVTTGKIEMNFKKINEN